MSIKKIVLLVLVALVLIAVFALKSLLDPAKYKDKIIAQVKQSTGRDLKLNGKMDWSLSPLGFEFSDVELSNVPGFGNEPFAKIGSLQMKAKLMPLFHKKLDVDTIYLDGFTLNLSKDANGKTNWSDLIKPSSEETKPQETTTSGGPEITIGKIEIDHANLAWHDLQSGGKYTLQNLSLKTGRIQKNETLSLEMGVDVKYGTPEKKSRLELNANAQQEPEGFDLNNFKLKLDKTTATGSASLKTKPAPQWKFDLDVDDFDLDQYRNPSGSASKPSEPEKPSESPLSLLQSLNATADLKFHKLKAFGLQVSNLHLQMLAKDGKLNFGPNAAELYSGTYNGNSAIDVSDGSPQFKFDEQLKKIQIGPLAKDFGALTKFSGVGNIQIQITAAGKDAASFKPSISGPIALQLNNGKIEGFNLQKIIESTRAAAAQATGKTVPATGDPKDETLFKTLSATMNFKKGVASTNDIKLDGASLRASGSGAADMLKEMLNFDLDVTLIGAENGKDLTVPVEVKGSFSKPEFGVNWGSLAKQTAKSAAKKGIESGLNKLLKKKKNQ